MYKMQRLEVSGAVRSLYGFVRRQRINYHNVLQICKHGLVSFQGKICKNLYMMRVLCSRADLGLLALLLEQLRSSGWPKQRLHLEG